MSLPQLVPRDGPPRPSTASLLRVVRFDGDELAGEAAAVAPTAPRRLWPVLFLLLGLASFPWDIALLSNVDHVDLPGDIGRLVDYSEAFGHGVGVLLCCLLAGLLDRRGAAVTGYLLIHAFGAGLFADLFKLFFTRLRPHHAVGLWDHFAMALPHLQSPLAASLSQEVRSFPSGHAAVAAGLAIGLSRLYPRGTALFALFAALAALQRIMAHAHYPSDCLIGIAAAFTAGYGLYYSPLKLHQRMLVE